MRTQDLLGRVGSSGGSKPSFGESLFRAYTTGQATKQEYEIANAILITEHPYWYAPQAYAPLPSILTAYVQARLQSIRPRDAGLATRLGDWFSQVHKRMDENSANLSLLLWALEKLTAVKLETKSDLIEKQISAYMGIVPPIEDLNRVMEVKKLDAHQRMREGI